MKTIKLDYRDEEHTIDDTKPEMLRFKLKLSRTQKKDLKTLKKELPKFSMIAFQPNTEDWTLEVHVLNSTIYDKIQKDILKAIGPVNPYR